MMWIKGNRNLDMWCRFQTCLLLYPLRNLVQLVTATASWSETSQVNLGGDFKVGYYTICQAWDIWRSTCQLKMQKLFNRKVEKRYKRTLEDLHRSTAQLGKYTEPHSAKSGPNEGAVKRLPFQVYQIETCLQTTLDQQSENYGVPCKLKARFTPLD